MDELFFGGWSVSGQGCQTYPYSHLKDVSVNKPQNVGGKYRIVTDTKMSLVLHTEPIALFVIKKN